MQRLETFFLVQKPVMESPVPFWVLTPRPYRTSVPPSASFALICPWATQAKQGRPAVVAEMA
jgi:hypothetical protein